MFSLLNSERMCKRSWN